MHNLQCRKDMGWDDLLPEKLQNEWKNIVRQANSSLPISIPRMVGNRNHKFKLIACCDASKSMYGVVVYIHNLDNNTLSFVCAKNRIVNVQLESKSIPALEVHAIDLATQVITELFIDLTGPSCLKPISIVGLEIFSDSLVALSWVSAYNIKFDKMQKRTPFVFNRVVHIAKLCEIHPIRFSFISGSSNPADFITRCVSSKQLLKTNYLTGPDLNSSNGEESSDTLSFEVPSPHSLPDESIQDCVAVSLGGTSGETPEHLIQEDRCSSFIHMKNILAKVLQFIHNVKSKVRKRCPNLFPGFVKDKNFFEDAGIHIIKTEQELAFPEIVQYFKSSQKTIKDIPNLVKQINIYRDRNGLLRVISKFERFNRNGRTCNFPILLPKNRRLTELIVSDVHKQYNHTGIYSVMNEMRKRFYIPSYFSVVKRVLKECVVCRKVNARAIKINQSSYRDFRVAPEKIPFSYSYLDYMGPFNVKEGNTKSKVWVLVFTCMWSRATNLKVCSNLSTEEFLRAFQLHSFEYGIPQYCISDQGTQIVAAGNKIQSFLSDFETQKYFQESGVKSLKFEQFHKGHSELGSLVETCVKMSKRLIYGAIRNNVLTVKDFEFLIAQTVHIINRRPIAFKEELRAAVGEVFPKPITPELILKGYDLNSVNIIPELQETDPDLDWIRDHPSHMVTDNYEKLRRVRERLKQLYEGEFLNTLIKQATDKKNRYHPVKHEILKEGDIVMIKEPMSKPQYYPMGIVRDVQINESGEVTGATVMKGCSRELTKRHASNLIPILSPNLSEKSESSCKVEQNDKVKLHKDKSQRKSAQKSREKIAELVSHNLV